MSFRSKERSILMHVSHAHLEGPQVPTKVTTDKEAIDKLSPGNAIIVFTPDSKNIPLLSLITICDE